MRGTNFRSGDGSRRDSARILHGAVGQDVGRPVMPFVPGLIELITQPQVQREPRRRLEVVLYVSGHAPLSISHDANRRSNLVVADPIENKVRRTVAGAVR